MRFTRVLVITIILGFAAAAAAQDAQKPDRTSAETFVRDLYNHYKADKPIINMPGQDGEAYLTPSLLKLVRKEAKLAKGEAGAIDGDPICDCQDWDDLTIISLSLKATGPRQALATMIFNEHWIHPKTVILSLLQQNGNWKIDDANSPGEASWREALNNGIAHGF